MKQMITTGIAELVVDLMFITGRPILVTENLNLTIDDIIPSSIDDHATYGVQVA